jgi:hypothetical protein
VRPKNKHGTPVDPVPFLVVALLGVTVAYSYGPIYLTELGFGLVQALGISTAVAAAVTVAAYHRYVWTARPDLRPEVPVDSRIRRLVYGVLLGIAVIALLSLPLLV